MHGIVSGIRGGQSVYLDDLFHQRHFMSEGHRSIDAFCQNDTLRERRNVADRGGEFSGLDQPGDQVDPPS